MAAMSADARAQSAGTSPFQPSLTDPRNVQRFSARVDHARDAAARRRRRRSDTAAVGRGRNRLRLHRRDRQEKESQEEARRAASAAAASAAAARAAAGRRRSHQRAADQGARALCRRLQAAGCAVAAAGAAAAGCLRAARHPRRHLPAEALGRGHARLRHQSVARPERRRARPTRWSSPRCKMQSEWSRHEFGADLRGSYSDVRLLSSLNRPLVDAKAIRAYRRHRATPRSTPRAGCYLSTDYPGSPNLPADYRQAAGLHDLRHHARPDAALQPSRTDGQGERRPDAIPEDS